MARQTKQRRIEELEAENGLLRDYAAELSDEREALGEESRAAHELVGRLAVENRRLSVEIGRLWAEIARRKE